MANIHTQQCFFPQPGEELNGLQGDRCRGRVLHFVQDNPTLTKRDVGSVHILLAFNLFFLGQALEATAFGDRFLKFESTWLTQATTHSITVIIAPDSCQSNNCS